MNDNFSRKRFNGPAAYPLGGFEIDVSNLFGSIVSIAVNADDAKAFLFASTNPGMAIVRVIVPSTGAEADGIVMTNWIFEINYTPGPLPIASELGTNWPVSDLPIWTRFTLSTGVDGVLASNVRLSTRPTNPAIYAFGSDDHFYKSTDGGTTWNQIVTPVDGNIIDLVVGCSGDSGQDIVMMLTNEGNYFVHISLDGGATWNVAPTLELGGGDLPTIAMDGVGYKGWATINVGGDVPSTTVWFIDIDGSGAWQGVLGFSPPLDIVATDAKVNMMYLLGANGELFSVDNLGNFYDSTPSYPEAVIGRSLDIDCTLQQLTMRVGGEATEYTLMVQQWIHEPIEPGEWTDVSDNSAPDIQGRIVMSVRMLAQIPYRSLLTPINDANYVQLLRKNLDAFPLDRVGDPTNAIYGQRRPSDIGFGGRRAVVGNVYQSGEGMETIIEFFVASFPA